MTQAVKQCPSCKNSFVIEPEDFAFYERMQVPPPDLCPDCRMIRKLLWRNERVLYKRECDMCKQSMLSMYHPRHTFPVYCNPCYHSDKWSAKEYAQNYNSEKSFLEQFKELLNKVPKVNVHVGSQAPSVNTEYQNFAGENKNCYLIFNSAKNEDCAYVRGLVNCKNVCDSYFGEQSEFVYESLNVARSSKVAFSENISDSLNCYFSRDCVSVQNCFGCVNLRHKSYFFFNKELSREEWERKVTEALGSSLSIEEVRNTFHNLSSELPRRESVMLKSVNCTGNYLYESKDCKNCFEVFGCENCKFGLAIKYAKDCYDLVGRGFQADLMLETVAAGSNCSRVVTAWSCETSHDIDYSFHVCTSHDCFGCVGLKHGVWSILNKEYSESEFASLRSKIIAELKASGNYGIYFPPELSPWAYNETLAAELYPKSKEEIISTGFRFEEEIPRTRGRETKSLQDVPNKIENITDDILKEIFVCSNCRYEERLRRRGAFHLINRTCDKCDKKVSTVYKKDFAPIVYCESCYQQEVI